MAACHEGCHLQQHISPVKNRLRLSPGACLILFIIIIEGSFFKMKAKLIQFYRERIQPRIEALKAKAMQLKQRAGAWLARYKRHLWLTAIVAATLVVIALLAYLWQSSPTFRGAAKGLAAVVTGCLAGLWALLRGNRSTEIPVPVVVTEPPQPPMEEEAFPVEISPDDGRL
jgi:hypothetical protein